MVLYWHLVVDVRIESSSSSSSEEVVEELRARVLDVLN